MPRVLLLLPTTTYRTKAFMDAALKLGVNIVAATEQPSTLAAQNPEGLLTLDFFDPAQSARKASEYAAQHKVDAVIPVDEDTAVIASSIAQALGLDNVEIRTGDALDLPVEGNSVDFVMSNGVLNLAPDKRQAFGEVIRILKPGGEFLYADIVVADELSESIRRDIDLWTG